MSRPSVVARPCTPDRQTGGEAGRQAGWQAGWQGSGRGSGVERRTGKPAVIETGRLTDELCDRQTDGQVRATTDTGRGMATICRPPSLRTSATVCLILMLLLLLFLRLIYFCSILPAAVSQWCSSLVPQTGLFSLFSSSRRSHSLQHSLCYLSFAMFFFFICTDLFTKNILILFYLFCFISFLFTLFFFTLVNYTSCKSRSSYFSSPHHQRRHHH